MLYRLFYLTRLYLRKQITDVPLFPYSTGMFNQDAATDKD